MRTKHLVCFTAILLVITASCTWSAGTWTVTNLGTGYAYTAYGGKQGGQAYVSGHSDAGFWNGTASSWVSLNPSWCTGGSSESRVDAMSADQQVGSAYGGLTGYEQHASLWTGTAASWVDLNPEGCRGSFAWGVSDGKQFGWGAKIGYGYRAFLWSGTAASAIDLTPAGYGRSIGRNIRGNQQAGEISIDGTDYHAALWNGTPESCVDLNPAGFAFSKAYDTSGTVQVGMAEPGVGNGLACLWRGSAASYVDLSPAGYGTSCASAISNGWQAGSAYKLEGGSGKPHVGIWNGTADSWIDLHNLLGGTFDYTFATDIEVIDQDIWVTGHGRDLVTGNYEALVWHGVGVVPEPSSFLVLLGGLGMLPFLKKRHG